MRVEPVSPRPTDDDVPLSERERSLVRALVAALLRSDAFLGALRLTVTVSPSATLPIPITWTVSPSRRHGMSALGGER